MNIFNKKHRPSIEEGFGFGNGRGDGSGFGKRPVNKVELK